MAEWDTYINVNFKDMPEETEQVAIIRDLTQGKYKYRSTYAKIIVSDPGKSRKVWYARQRSMIHPCSMKILEFVNIIPKGFKLVTPEKKSTRSCTKKWVPPKEKVYLEDIPARY